MHSWKACSDENRRATRGSLGGRSPMLAGLAGGRGRRSVLTFNLCKPRERRELPTAPDRNANTAAFGIPRRALNESQNAGGQSGGARCRNRSLAKSEGREKLIFLGDQIDDHAIFVQNAQTPSGAEFPDGRRWIDTVVDQAEKLDPRPIGLTQNCAQLIRRRLLRLVIKSTQRHEPTSVVRLTP